MKRSELKKKIEIQKRFATRNARIATIVICCVLFPEFYLIRYQREIYMKYISIEQLILTIALIIAGLLIWLTLSNFKRTGLCCPFCAEVFDKNSWEIALKTSKCDKCGKRIVEDD